MENHVLQLTNCFDLTPLQQKDIENWVCLLSKKNTLPPPLNSISKISSIYTLDPKLDIIDIQNELIKNPPKNLYSIQCGIKFQTSTLVKMTEELFSTLKESGGAIIAFPDIVDRIYIEGIEIDLLNKKYPRKTFEIVDPITFISDLIRNTQLNFVENENHKYARLFLPPYEDDVVEILDVDLIEKRAIVKLWPRFIDNSNNSTIGPAPFDFTRFQNIDSYKCKVYLSFDKKKVVDGFIYKDMKFYGEFLIMKVDLENLVTWSSNISDEELEKFSNETIKSHNNYIRPRMPDINNNPPSEPEISIPETIQQQNLETTQNSEQNIEESNDDHEKSYISSESDKIDKYSKENSNEEVIEAVSNENINSLDITDEENHIGEENNQISENFGSLSEEKNEIGEVNIGNIAQDDTINQDKQEIPTETQIQNNNMEITPEATENLGVHENKQDKESNDVNNPAVLENPENIEIILTEKEEKYVESVGKTEETSIQQIDQDQFQKIGQTAAETAYINKNDPEKTESVQKQPFNEEIHSNKGEITNYNFYQSPDNISTHIPLDTSYNEKSSIQIHKETKNNEISYIHGEKVTKTSYENAYSDNNMNECIHSDISSKEKIIEGNTPQNIELSQYNGTNIHESTENQVKIDLEKQNSEKDISGVGNTETTNTNNENNHTDQDQRQNNWTIEEIHSDIINLRTETSEEDKEVLSNNVVLNVPRIERSTSIGDPDANISASHKPKPQIVQSAPSIQIQLGVRPVRGKQIRSDAQLIAQLGGKKQLSPHEMEEKEKKKQAKQKKLIEKMQEQARISEQLKLRNQKIEEEKRRIEEENERKMEEERQRLLEEKLRKEEEERKARENEKILIEKIEIEERKKNDQFIGNRIINDNIIMREIISRMHENKNNFHFKKLLHPSQESTPNDEDFQIGDIVTDPSSMEKFIVLDRNGKDLLIAKYDAIIESRTDNMIKSGESITFAQQKTDIFPLPGDLIEFNQDIMAVVDVTSGYCICIDSFGTLRRLEANQPWSRLKDHDNVKDSAGQSLYRGDSVSALYNRVRYKGIVDHTYNGKIYGTFWNSNSSDTSSLTHLVLDSDHVYRIC